jgi:hypothetical protein
LFSKFHFNLVVISNRLAPNNVIGKNNTIYEGKEAVGGGGFAY